MFRGYNKPSRQNIFGPSAIGGTWANARQNALYMRGEGLPFNDYRQDALSPLARIGISNCEMNLEEPTLIYVHTCFGSPEKSKSKSFHKGFLRKGGKFKSIE